MQTFFAIRQSVGKLCNLKMTLHLDWMQEMKWALACVRLLLAGPVLELLPVWRPGFQGTCTLISVDIEFKCCLIAFRQAFIILDASMDRHCQKSAWCQLYSSISNLTSVTNEVRYCVFCGNKTSQYIESSARPHCSSQPPAKYFISEPLDGSVSVKLFSFERRITMPARQQTNKNLK